MNIINEQIVNECKTFIAKTLMAASNTNTFIYGVDTNKLSEIYYNINSDNAQELYDNAKNIVNRQIWVNRYDFDQNMYNSSGKIIIGGLLLAGVGYCLSEINTIFIGLMFIGSVICLIGFVMAFSIGY